MHVVSFPDLQHTHTRVWAQDTLLVGSTIQRRCRSYTPSSYVNYTFLPTY